MLLTETILKKELLEFAKIYLDNKLTIYRTWSEGELLYDEYMDVVYEIKEEYGLTTRQAVEEFLNNPDFQEYDTFKQDAIEEIVNDFLDEFDRNDLEEEFGTCLDDKLKEYLDKKLRYNLNIRELMDKSGVR